MIDKRIDPRLEKLPDNGWVRGRHFNPLVDDVYRGRAGNVPPDQTVENRLLIRIVAAADPVDGRRAYTWVQARPIEDGKTQDDPLRFGGDYLTWPACPRSGNPDVPLDGSAIVWAWPSDGGSYMEFEWDQQEFWFRITGSSGSLYAGTQVYPDVGGTFTTMDGGHVVTTTQNALRERHGVEGIVNNTIVKAWRGYSSGKPQVIPRRTQAGDGDAVNEIQTLAIVRAVGGTWTLNWDGSDTAAIDWDADAAAVQAAIDGLVAAPDLTVSGAGTEADPFVLEWNDFGADYPMFTADESDLVGDQEWLFEAGASSIPANCVGEEGEADDVLLLTGDTWTDIPGTDVEITVSEEGNAVLHAVFEFDGNDTAEVVIDGAGAGSLDVYEGRVLIDDVDVGPWARCALTHPAEVKTIPLPPIIVTLAAGTYTVKMQARRGSGTGSGATGLNTRWTLISSCEGGGGVPPDININNLYVNNYYTYSPYEITLENNVTNLTINKSLTLINLTQNVEVTNLFFSRTFLEGDQIQIINVSTQYYLTLKITGNIDTYSLTEVSIGPNMVFRFQYIGGGVKLYKEPCWHQPYRPAQITTNQTSYALAWSATYFDFDLNANYSVHGFNNYYPGRLFYFFNRSNFTVTIPHDSGSAGTPAQRVYTQNGQSAYIGPNQGAWFMWDAQAQRWRMLTGQVRYQMSITEDADGLKLMGDVDTPGNNYVYGTSSLGTKTWIPQADLPAPAGSVAWVKVTKTYADLAAANTTNQITIYTLPAKGIVHGAIMKTTAIFGGGGIASYTLNLGDSTAATGYITGYDGAAFNGTNWGNSGNKLVHGATGSNDLGATMDIKLQAVSTGANLNAATAGAVEIWLLLSTLP